MSYLGPVSRWVAGVSVVMLIATATPAADLPADLSRCSELATRGRFNDVIDILSPYESLELDDEARYIVSAELGRAHFHSGTYAAAHALFRKAVRLRPDRVETALYLQATSWVTGDRAQALAILESVLASGARDLWLAVTLPGEDSFLADPEVWEILQRHSIPVAVNVTTGSVLGVELGQDRAQVEQTLGAARAEAAAPVLTAEAGPETIWAFSFDEAGALQNVTLYADHMLRYTPYRLQLGQGLDWQLTPDSARQALGEARRESFGADRSVRLEWERGKIRLTLDFFVVQAHRLAVYPRSEFALNSLRIESVPDQPKDPAD